MRITAAKQIQLAVPEINAKLGGDNILRVGVGITTGMGFTANVGSDSCSDYTMMGDVVNIGSRLQGLATAGEILVSKDFYDTVDATYPNAQKAGVGSPGHQRAGTRILSDILRRRPY